MTRFLTVAGLIMAISPTAVAFDIDEAIRMCAAHPNCFHGERDAGGGLTLVIGGSPNHSAYLRCPQAGDCMPIRRLDRSRLEPVDQVDGQLVSPPPRNTPRRVGWYRSGR